MHGSDWALGGRFGLRLAWWRPAAGLERQERQERQVRRPPADRLAPEHVQGSHRQCERASIRGNRCGLCESIVTHQCDGNLLGFRPRHCTARNNFISSYGRLWWRRGATWTPPQFREKPKLLRQSSVSRPSRIPIRRQTNLTRRGRTCYSRNGVTTPPRVGAQRQEKGRRIGHDADAYKLASSCVSSSRTRL